MQGMLCAVIVLCAVVVAVLMRACGSIGKVLKTLLRHQNPAVKLLLLLVSQVWRWAQPRYLWPVSLATLACGSIKTQGLPMAPELLGSLPPKQ